VNDVKKKARWLYYGSTLLFIGFLLLSGGPLRRLFGDHLEASREVGTVAAIFAWTLMVVAYKCETRRADQEAR
jgi:hypothetical protein